jgi:hypothetical protein
MIDWVSDRQGSHRTYPACLNKSFLLSDYSWDSWF